MTSFAESARQKVLHMAGELLVESTRVGIMRSVDATETSRWLKELSKALRDACRDVDESPGGSPVDGKDESKQREARERLVVALPHIQIAANMAKLQEPEGTVGLAIVSRRPDGSGRVTLTSELEPFLADVLTLLGFESFEELVRSKEGN